MSGTRSSNAINAIPAFGLPIGTHCIEDYIAGVRSPQRIWFDNLFIAIPLFIHIVQFNTEAI